MSSFFWKFCSLNVRLRRLGVIDLICFYLVSMGPHPSNGLWPLTVFHATSIYGFPYCLLEKPIRHIIHSIYESVWPFSFSFFLSMFSLFVIVIFQPCRPSRRNSSIIFFQPFYPFLMIKWIYSLIFCVSL